MKQKGSSERYEGVKPCERFHRLFRLFVTLGRTVMAAVPPFGSFNNEEGKGVVKQVVGAWFFFGAALRRRFSRRLREHDKGEHRAVFHPTPTGVGGR
jgi:hypothetical protein